ncbi:uncharacterized protein LOC126902717 [Daktulosphaira vitifoliae]|uniref:uncharacterized protein LOC126902717 n=1 Tax=Daktulosphaira vitifoliae TaxID=58002 RepID=UPI0021AAF33D|nr:uncharacterized protein LOC126902717 [Daktulosphaira vitifoliae]
MSSAADQISQKEQRQPLPADPDWLSGVISRLIDKPQNAVTVITDETCTTPAVADPHNVLSSIVAVHIVYSVEGFQGTQSLDVVIKSLPQEPYSRAFVLEAQFDYREVHFYNTVLTELKDLEENTLQLNDRTTMGDMPIAKCYFAGMNANGRDESMLVLEDLSKRGFTAADFTTGLTFKEAKLALRSIARIHATSLALKLKHGPLTERWPFLFQTCRATLSYQALVERGMPQLHVFLRSKGSQYDGLINTLRSICRVTKQIIGTLMIPKEPIGLMTHTDFWCNNLMFGKQDQCVIIDWQMISYSRPTNDVALLLVSSLSTETRRQHSSELVDCYWETFTNHANKLGVDIEGQLEYSRNTLDEDMRESKLLAVLLCIGSVDVALGNKDTEQRLLDLLTDLQDEGVFSRHLTEISA